MPIPVASMDTWATIQHRSLAQPAWDGQVQAAGKAATLSRLVTSSWCPISSTLGPDSSSSTVSPESRMAAGSCGACTPNQNVIMRLRITCASCRSTAGLAAASSSLQLTGLELQC